FFAGPTAGGTAGDAGGGAACSGRDGSGGPSGRFALCKPERGTRNVSFSSTGSGGGCRFAPGGAFTSRFVAGSCAGSTSSESNGDGASISPGRAGGGRS